MAGQRKDYLTRDEYFMSLTSLSTLRNFHFYQGACIVDKEHRILSVGYEDIPYYISPNVESDSSYFTVDPLSNALYSFKGRRQEFWNGTIYLSSFPNYEESKYIAQARFHKVIYLTNNVSKNVEYISRKILDSAGVEIEPYYTTHYTLQDYLHFLKDLKQVLRGHIGKVEQGPFLHDEYFMSVAVLSALRSKDPSTQVGACLVDRKNYILSISYNGTPYGMHDDELPWDSLGEEDHNIIFMKNPYVVHAEVNAFDNYRGNPIDFRHAKMYVIYSPCELCSMKLAQTGIDRVIYLREYTKNSESKRSYKWLSRAKIVPNLYDDSHDYTKEECIHLFQDTTKVIKKNLGK